MIISYNFFDGQVFDTTYGHKGYYHIENYEGKLDEILIDEDLSTDNTVNKPTGWSYYTVMDAKFQNTIEAGSLTANNMIITAVRFQRRRFDELEWQNLIDIPYVQGEKTLYEFIDKYIQNDFGYQYALVPLTETVHGQRVESEEIVADFDGYFLCDDENNFRLFYDTDFSSMDYVSPSAVHEPLNSPFPIVTYNATTNYRTGSMKALILSSATENRTDGKISIRSEKVLRDRLVSFLRNRKPKIIKGMNSESLLITIIDNPQITHNQNINGIAEVSFNYVEIGSISTDSLKLNGLLKNNGISEVF